MAVLNFNIKEKKPWYKPSEYYTSPLSWLPGVRDQWPLLPERVHFIDSTLREGEEATGTAFSIEDKIEIVRKLSDAGVEWFDVGYPAVNRAQREDLEQLRNSGLKVGWYCLIQVGVDEWMKAIDVSVGAGCNRIKITGVGGGPRWGGYTRHGRVLHAFTLDGEKRILDAVDYCKKEYPDATVIVGPTDVTRGLLKPEPLVNLYRRCVEHGVDMVSVIDTFGVSEPTSIRYLTSEIKKAVGDTPINCHCHNDFGLAVANSVASVEGGASWIQTTVNGLGDRAGNASFEECVATLEILHGVDTGIKMNRLYEIAKFVEKTGGLKCQPHKAITGENAWLEESHASFLIQMRDSGADLLRGEAYKPELVGQKHNVVISKTTLTQNFIKYALNKLNLSVNDENVKIIIKETLKKIDNKTEKGLPRYLTEEEFYELCKKSLK